MTATAMTDAGIGRIELDRPPLNILTRDLLKRIRFDVERLAEQPDVRVLLLTATGEHFSGGADVREHLPPHHLSLIPDFLDAIAALDGFPLPVVAAVRGKCLGGGFELVQPVDVIVAGASAVFGQPEIALGVFPPAACILLPERLPAAIAARLIYRGDNITAAEAERWGLVARVVADDDVERAALEEASRIACHSAVALRAAKAALRGAGAAERRAALRAAGNIYMHDLMESHDAVEGLRAFTEKRRPVWRHA
jgi:cyclohexa-1,5-dienecarbonyl-CoA hydratase